MASPLQPPPWKEGGRLHTLMPLPHFSTPYPRPHRAASSRCVSLPLKRGARAIPGGMVWSWPRPPRTGHAHPAQATPAPSRPRPACRVRRTSGLGCHSSGLLSCSRSLYCNHQRRQVALLSQTPPKLCLDGWLCAF